MAIFKNISNQSVAIFAYDSTSGSGIINDSTNITAYISLDVSTPTSINDTNPTEIDSTAMPGMYMFNLTQSETNADRIIIYPSTTTENVIIDPIIIYTEPYIYDKIKDIQSMAKGDFTIDTTGRTIEYKDPDNTGNVLYTWNYSEDGKIRTVTTP